MKLGKVREEVYYFSQKASEANQKLAIAGIALIWLFKVTVNSNIQVSLILFLALISFIASLAVEIIHYSILAPIWSKHYNNEYRRLSLNSQDLTNIEETEVDEPSEGNLLGWVLFYGKLLLLLIGYLLFFIHVIENVEII
jgi:hypothetical protein